MSDTTTQELTHVRLYVTGVSPLVLSAYRELRKCGFGRHDANLIIAGVVFVSGDGIVDVRKVVGP